LIATHAAPDDELPRLNYPAEVPPYVSELKGAMLANELPKPTLGGAAGRRRCAVHRGGFRPE
jgi:hypothetical protein